MTLRSRWRRLLALFTAALLAAAVLLPAPPAAAEQAGKLMLVMDSSGSMKEKLPDGDTRIGAAKEALHTVVDDLPGDQPVGLRVYGAKVFDRSQKGACTDSQRVVDVATDNRDALKDAIEKYRPYGETPIGYALQQAGEDLGGSGQRTIVLVSDGEPNCEPDPCQVAADLAKKGIDLRIEVVGFDVDAKARGMLQCIADRGNGTYYDADSAADLGRALDTVATRAARPYEQGGRPISGTETAEDAPELSEGDWIDELGGSDKERSELFYTARRSLPGSTFHISASILTQDESDSLTVRILSDDTQCGFDTDAHGVEQGQLISAAVTAPGYKTWDDACNDSDEFTVVVNRGMGSGQGNGGKRTVPVEIRVNEEPPVADVDALPKEQDAPTYKAVSLAKHPSKTTGGSSFTEATPIKPGSYRGNIVPGEVQIFSVPVNWGQHLVATSKVKPLSTQLADEVGTTWLTTQLYSPSRAAAANLLESKYQRLLSDNGTVGGATSFAVSYRGREDLRERAAAVNRAGEYYVAVGLSPDAGKNYQVPFTLGIDVRGAVEGEPTYQRSTSPTASAGTSGSSDAESPSPSAPQSASSTASASASASAEPIDRTGSGPTAASEPTAAEQSDDSGRTVWVALLIGGLGLATILAGATVLVVFLLRRR